MCGIQRNGAIFKIFIWGICPLGTNFGTFWFWPPRLQWSLLQDAWMQVHEIFSTFRRRVKDCPCENSAFYHSRGCRNETWKKTWTFFTHRRKYYLFLSSVKWIENIFLVSLSSQTALLAVRLLLNLKKDFLAKGAEAFCPSPCIRCGVPCETQSGSTVYQVSKEIFGTDPASFVECPKRGRRYS